MTVNIEIQTQFKDLQQRFVASLGGLILELDSLANALPVHGDPAAVIDAVRFRVHKLAGTAPSLGFRSVGALAGQVETTIERWKTSAGADLEHRIREMLETLLDEMELVLDAEDPADALAAAARA